VDGQLKLGFRGGVGCLEGLVDLFAHAELLEEQAGLVGLVGV
jgi:hypothetical protein